VDDEFDNIVDLALRELGHGDFCKKVSQGLGNFGEHLE
jgi:hypothetical protein